MIRIQMRGRACSKKFEMGATMVEYTIMAAVFSIALIIVVGLMRASVDEGFRKVCQAFDSASPSDVECKD